MKNEPTKPKTNDAVSGRVEPIVMYERKEQLLSEAKAKIDAMSSEEFEAFIISCVPAALFED